MVSKGQGVTLPMYLMWLVAAVVGVLLTSLDLFRTIFTSRNVEYLESGQNDYASQGGDFLLEAHNTLI